MVVGVLVGVLVYGFFVHRVGEHSPLLAHPARATPPERQGGHQDTGTIIQELGRSARACFLGS